MKNDKNNVRKEEDTQPVSKNKLTTDADAFFCATFSEVAAVELAEAPSFIEILRVGDWQHEKHGRIKVTEATIDNMIKNFNDGVRRTFVDGQPTLDIDYDHKAKTDKAAGWFGKLEKRSHKLTDGKTVASLFMQPKEWTPDARDAIKKGEYKFFSVEFNDWKDPETGKQYKDVLFGGALTNRPFVKELQPIQLAETVEAETEGEKIKKGALKMLKLKELLTSRGLTFAEDVSADLVEEKALETIKTLSEDVAAKDKLLAEATVKAAEEAKKLADAEVIVAESKKLAEEAKKAADAIKSAEVVKLAETKIEPAKLKDAKHWFNVKLAEGKFAELTEILADMSVALKENGKLKKETSDDGDEDDAELTESQKTDKEVTAYMKENKIEEKDYGKALLAVKKIKAEKGA